MFAVGSRGSIDDLCRRISRRRQINASWKFNGVESFFPAKCLLSSRHEVPANQILAGALGCSFVLIPKWEPTTPPSFSFHFQHCPLPS